VWRPGRRQRARIASNGSSSPTPVDVSNGTLTLDAGKHVVRWTVIGEENVPPVFQTVVGEEDVLPSFKRSSSIPGCKRARASSSAIAFRPSCP
jgi:hypothetical protein